MIATNSLKDEYIASVRRAFNEDDFEGLLTLGLKARAAYQVGKLTIHEYYEIAQELKKLAQI